jgi:hypothetical protein
MGYTMAAIKEVNKAHGGHWFDRSSMRFFDTRLGQTVYQGPGGIYFVTSEQFHDGAFHGARKFTVRQFNPETGDVETAGKFQAYTTGEGARAAAKMLAARPDRCPLCLGYAETEGRSVKCPECGQFDRRFGN